MKDNKARAIAEEKYVDCLSYLFSDNFCFTGILHLSSNKTSYFNSQKLLFLSVRKRKICSFTSLSERERTTQRERDSHLLSLKRIYLLSYSDKLTFISF